MIRIITIIGARPQIIKAAAISRVMRSHYADRIEEKLIHTGQHYDQDMSASFFEELNIPAPDFQLKIDADHSGAQTAEMLQKIESILLVEKPTAVLVYGDTNSTLAASLAAAKLNIPILHIEAGMRSFNKQMPEEINRIICDHSSTLLFTPTKQGWLNLEKEGFDLNNEPPYHVDNPKVYHCGDIMYDNARYFGGSSVVDDKLEKFDLPDSFVLCTVHRANNVDEPERLNAIFMALLQLVQQKGATIVLPLHPRTKKMMGQLLRDDVRTAIENTHGLRLIPPVSFLEIIALEKNADLIITDSGGVQKEAFFFEKPCLILRPKTEWVEIVENGNAMLCDADKDRILNAYDALTQKRDYTYPTFYGDGNAADFICQKILSCFA